jgi:hypothetical protein
MAGERKPPPDPGKCDWCVYRYVSSSPAGMVCRRFPPRADVSVSEAIWPIIQAEWWCGEYRAANTATATPA